MISTIRLKKFSLLALIKSFVFSFWLKDARFKLKRIGGYLSQDRNILDIGTGVGSVCQLLQQEGYKVTPLDIDDRTLTENVSPRIYDGNNIPFPNDYFDTSLLLTVLHHTNDPESVLREVVRVSKNIVIIEDVYSNKLQQYLTYIFDSIFNLEFIGHPHSNKTHVDWLKLFNELGLTLKNSRSDRFLLFFRQVTYHLEKE